MRAYKILVSLVVLIALCGQVLAANIDKVNVINNNSLELVASPDVTFSDTNIEGDLKLLKDLKISFSVKDTENNKKVLLNLSDELEINTSYTLVSVF
jgi:hypothetical protein